MVSDIISGRLADVSFYLSSLLMSCGIPLDCDLARRILLVVPMTLILIAWNEFDLITRFVASRLRVCRKLLIR